MACGRRSFETFQERQIEYFVHRQRFWNLSPAASLVQIGFELLVGHQKAFDKNTTDFFVSFRGDPGRHLEALLDVAHHPGLVAANVRDDVAHGAKHVSHQLGLLLDSLSAGDHAHPRHLDQRSAARQDFVSFLRHGAGEGRAKHRRGDRTLLQRGQADGGAAGLNKSYFFRIDTAVLHHHDAVAVAVGAQSGRAALYTTPPWP
jgi:hypothetical protein